MTAARSRSASIRLRGRSFVALVLTPEPPIADWLVELGAQIRRSPAVFTGRPVVVDLSALSRQEPHLQTLMDGMQAHGMRIIGIEGADPSWPGIEAWGRAPILPAGRAGRAIA